MVDQIKDIKAASVVELKKLLTEARETVRALRFKDANRQLANIRSLRQAKKKIARILTILKQKQDGKQGQ